MNFSLNILDWQARAPGLHDDAQWRAWAHNPTPVDRQAPLAKPQELPMMTARRLSVGSRLAVDSGLTLLRRHAPDAVVYASRHGELERNFRILQALAARQPVSPTDFAMSVHNAAVGSLTITAKQPLVSSSLSAGVDTFQQALCEVYCLLNAGYQRVLLVDFDGEIPSFYHPDLPPQMPTWPWAVALLLEAGDDWRCSSEPTADADEPALPQSLQFLQHWLSGAAGFTLMGDHRAWRWSPS